MKKLIYVFLIIGLPVISLAGNNEFSYDKQAVSKEFSQLNKVSSIIETSDITYSEFSKSPLFEGDLQLTGHIAIQPKFTIDDMDWAAFAWGFCCWPIGIFIYMLPSQDKSSEQKTSFWIGLIVNLVLSGPAYYLRY